MCTGCVALVYCNPSVAFGRSTLNFLGAKSETTLLFKDVGWASPSPIGRLAGWIICSEMMSSATLICYYVTIMPATTASSCSGEWQGLALGCSQYTLLRL